jgi:hypothetical protein
LTDAVQNPQSPSKIISGRMQSIYAGQMSPIV